MSRRKSASTRHRIQPQRRRIHLDSNLSMERLEQRQLLANCTGITDVVEYREFRNVAVDSIECLSATQISTIPDGWWLGRMSSDARAALSADQIRALDVSRVAIDKLTASQVAELSVEQVQSLDYRQFRYLQPSQVPHLTAVQVGSIPDGWWFGRMSGDSRAALTAEQIPDLNVAPVGIDRLTPGQVTSLSADQVRSLDFRQFRYLDAKQSPVLTAEQISSIPDGWWFGRMSQDARAALTGEQVTSLNVASAGIDKLSSGQIAALTTEQLRAINYKQFRYLSAGEAPSLTSAQVASIPDSWWFSRMSPDARKSLTSEQIRSLDVAAVGIGQLTTEQIGYLAGSQVEVLGFKEFRYLNGEQTPSLTHEQIASIPDGWWFTRMSDEARAALTAEQIPSLNVAKTGIAALTPQQVRALAVDQVRALSFQQFRYLNSEQTPHLTNAQLSSIPDGWWFTRMSDAARAGLTVGQIPALNVAAIGIGALNPGQIAGLSADQIHALDYRQFRYLNQQQATMLSGEQISSIPDSWWFTRMGEAPRAQLTDQQITHLDTAHVSIRHLTPLQRNALTPAQVRSLDAADLPYLSAEQAAHVSNEQLAAIENSWQFKKIPDEVRAEFTRDQLFSVNEEVMASTLGLPASFAVSAEEHVMDNSGVHPDEVDKQHEHSAALQLVPHGEATFVTSQSGNWTDPGTWETQSIPDAGAKVLIQHGHQVVFDAVITPGEAVETVRVDGLLQFAHDVDTQLAVDTIVVDPIGQLHIGTDQQPIDDNVAARIVFVGDTAIDQSWDPHQLSRGLVSHGEVRMHGEEVTPYLALQVDPLKGDTELVLESVPVNWQVGDLLVLTGTQSNYAKNQDEELEIIAIDGNTVTIDADTETPGQQSLAYNHVTPDGDDRRTSSDPGDISPDGDHLSVYVANVNRNVVLISESPEFNDRRGHVMFMHNQDVDIDNAGFYGLGRSDKRNPANDPVFDDDGNLIEDTGLNPRGRYSVHFHRAGTSFDDNPGLITGSAVVDSPGWGIVNHESYVHAHNNVAFHVVGASFVTEFGNEIGSFVGNLSINNSGSGHGLESREDIFDFGHGGHGYWAQGPLVKFDNNIAAGSKDGAFVFFTQSSETRIDARLLSDPTLAAGRDSVPVGSVPFESVQNNTAFASRRGLETWFHQTHMNDGQSYIDGFTSWNTRSEGIFTPYTGRTTIREATLVGNVNHPRGTAIGRNNVTNQMTYDDVTALGYQVGITVPVNRDTTIIDGRFSAARAIQIDRAHDELREVDIIGDPLFETLSDAQLGEREQFDIFMNGGFQMDNFDLETLFTPDITRLGTVQFNNHQIFYYEQAANFVPFREGAVPDFIPEELVGLTNAELHDQFGIALAGATAHPDAQPEDRINGLVGPRVDYPDPLKLLSRKYTNVLQGYELVYFDSMGNRVTETVDLSEGWNLLTREVDGATRTLFVFGDIQPPSFELHGEPAVNPDGLRFGITIRGTVFDNSTGQKNFKRTFKNLESLPVTTIDGQQYLVLEFDIKDLAGNVTPVTVHILLDPDAPLVPGTGQENLPARDLPTTLYELLQFYIIV